MEVPVQLIVKVNPIIQEMEGVLDPHVVLHVLHIARTMPTTQEVEAVRAQVVRHSVGMVVLQTVRMIVIENVQKIVMTFVEDHVVPNVSVVVVIIVKVVVLMDVEMLQQVPDVMSAHILVRLFASLFVRERVVVLV